MKKVITIIAVLIAFIAVGYAGFNSPTPVPGASLYDRLGGEQGITELVDEVVAAHGNNPVISARFKKYGDQPERLAMIKKHTVQFFSMGSGGPKVYEGRDLPTTHGGMNISPAEYMAVVDDILMVCDNRDIDEKSKNEVLAILWSLKGMIIAQ